MTERRNKDWLQAFLSYASTGEAPLKTLFWTGVSTIAGALRRRVWIDMKYFQWTPCFYVILVAPPGIISKSTTVNVGINLLREVPGIHFGPDVVTWQALVESMGQSTESAYEEATDTYHPMSAITICSDEFGTFLDPDDRAMVDALVSLWDGKKGTFTKVTKASGSDSVQNPWLNIIACTTPGWLKDNFPESMVGGGFTSRCVFVFADRKRQLVAYPGLSVPSDFDQVRADLIHDLECISQMIGEFRLSPEAVKWGTEWYSSHWDNIPEHLNNERFGGYLARKQTHIHKLALVLSASRSSSLIIEREILEISSEMITALEADMPRVFENIGQSESAKGVSELVYIVLSKRVISQTDLYRLMFRTMKAKEFQEALTSAMLAGFLRVENTPKGGMIYALRDLPQTSP